jgi:hypothetical protein
VTGVIDEALAQLNPLVQHIIKAIGNDLLTQPHHNGLGLLDWSYNRDPAYDMTGTFALGSTVDLPKLIFHESLLPGEFTFSLSASAFAVDAPEPSAVLILAPALLGLVALRWRTAHRVENLAGTGTLRAIKQGNAALCNRWGAEPKSRFALRCWLKVVTPI